MTKSCSCGSIRSSSHPGRWFFTLACAFALAAEARGDALIEALKEEKGFYENFGETNFQKLEIQKEIKSYYDLFGDHITDGFFIYDLAQHKNTIKSDVVADSTFLNQNIIFESKEFKSNFNNLVITRDALGSAKFAFMVGDQIQTKFTPLTLNRLYFHGLRWDLHTSGLKMTTVVSRTRPDWLAKNFGGDKPNSGWSQVSYPHLASDWYAPVDGIGKETPDQLETYNVDPTNKSLFGDYDMLFGLHAENNLGNFLNYGITYMNHHHSDIKQGEKWYGGLPEEYFPDEIHFEVYDLTPDSLEDAGAVVREFYMEVDGEKSFPFEVYSPVGSDSILEAFGANQPVYNADGARPLIFVFKPGFALGRRPRDFKNLKFIYTISGNYQVFVSTNRFSQSGSQTVEKSYESRDRNRRDPTLNAQPPSIFYGEFIARSPTLISQVKNPSQVSYPNERSYVYEYKLNISSETFGINASAKLGDFNLKSELQINSKRYLLPGARGETEIRRNAAGFLEIIGDAITGLNLAGRAYYLAPDWNTGLDDYNVSPFFSRKVLSLPSKSLNDPYISEYLDPTFPLSNNFHTLDDNEDGDQFVEGEARRYPGDGGGVGDYFYSGALKSTSSKMVRLNLPNGFERVYDDPNGVISDRVDKNKNGIADYREDFLLFYSDPPVFELGNDLNNNGIYDQEDDDLYPDIFFITEGEFPEYNPSPVYIYTSNGWRSFGIQGATLRGRYTFNTYFSSEFGGTYETGIARDFAIEDKGAMDFVTYAGPEGALNTNFNLYNTTRYKRIKRSAGLELNLENEIRYLEDNIRNDAVQTVAETFGNPISYGVLTDQLQYRKALVDNFIIRGVYRPRNFLAQTNLRLGGERRFAIPGDPYLVTKTIYNPFRKFGQFQYEDRYVDYPDLNVMKVNWVGKLGYDLTWSKQYEDGWRQYLNPLRRLQVSPQFKLSYDYITPKLPWEPDAGLAVNPRDNPYPLEDSTQYRIDYRDFIDGNQNLVNVVPILRLSYQLAEKTRLEMGRQWLRYYDLLTKENNHLKTTTLFQIRSNDTYKGNNVNLILGMRMENWDFDLEGKLGKDPVLDVGSLYDLNSFEIFARIYTGI